MPRRRSKRCRVADIAARCACLKLPGKSACRTARAQLRHARPGKVGAPTVTQRINSDSLRHGPAQRFPTIFPVFLLAPKAGSEARLRRVHRVEQLPGTILRTGGSYRIADMTGDVDFEGLVNLHYASLYRFALSLTRKESEAADLTQQTFYVWASKGHQLEDASKVKSWLFTTLYREFLQSRRRETRFVHEELEEASAALPVVEPMAVQQLEAHDVVQLLGRLDETFQAPLALFYLEDYACREIATILAIPLGTVKSRIARGLAQLQRFIAGEIKRAEKAGKGEA